MDNLDLQAELLEIAGQLSAVLVLLNCIARTSTPEVAAVLAGTVTEAKHAIRQRFAPTEGSPHPMLEPALRSLAIVEQGLAAALQPVPQPPGKGTVQ